MASKKSSKAQAASVKKQKSELARLIKLGLYKGDARKPPTKYAQRQIKLYRNVLEGREKVVMLPKRTKAREYNEVFKTKYRKVVVPARKGEKFFYNKKSGEIFSYNTEYGHKIRRIFPKHALTEKGADALPKDRNIRFAIPIGSGSGMRRQRFSTYKELANYMNSDSLKGYNNWQKYVEIEEILDAEKPDDEEDE